MREFSSQFLDNQPEIDWEAVKPGLDWTMDWTVDWTMDWTVDWTVDWTMDWTAREKGKGDPFALCSPSSV